MIPVREWMTDSSADDVISRAPNNIINKVLLIKVTIHYCRRCRWLLRSAWMGQELLTTFDEDISELSLVPNNAGDFSVWVNQTCIWERKRDGGFPELPILKQRLRDIIAPNKSLGHSDFHVRQ
ncbi:MAG: selenoprotein W-related protein [Candidatus Endobugula sp.]|jgi:selenoprotein W-related protein